MLNSEFPIPTRGGRLVSQPLSDSFGLELEIQLQSELDNPGVARRENLPEGACVTPDIRRIEIRVIECVEEFRAELNTALFVQLEILRQVEIEIDVSRPSHYTDTGSSEGLRRWIEGRKRIRIEPTVNCLLRRRQLGICDQIGSRLTLSAKIQDSAAAQCCR